MGDCTIRIEKLQNGFNVRMTDPEIVKANNERPKDGKDYTPWRDPQVTYTFKSSAEVVEFIKNNIDKAVPTDDYSSSFDAAVKDMD